MANKHSKNKDFTARIVPPKETFSGCILTNLDPNYVRLDDEDDCIPLSLNLPDVNPEEIGINTSPDDEEEAQDIYQKKDLGKLLMRIGLHDRSDELPFFDDDPCFYTMESPRPYVLFEDDIPMPDAIDRTEELAEADTSIELEIKSGLFGG